MRISTSEIKKLARQMLKGNYLIALVFLLTSEVVQSVPQMLIFTFAPDSAVLAYIADVYGLFFSGIFGLATAAFFISLFRAQTSFSGALSCGFSNVMKAVVLYILYTVKVVLYSLLLIIPGIIAAFKYSMAFYVMYDNPQLSPSQCLRESERIMNGNKLALFILELSFVPLQIIASIPRGIYVYRNFPLNFDFMSFDSVTEMVAVFDSTISVLLGLLAILVIAYSTTAHACFYDIISERLVFAGSEGSVNAQIIEESDNAADAADDDHE